MYILEGVLMQASTCPVHGDACVKLKFRDFKYPLRHSAPAVLELFQEAHSRAQAASVTPAPAYPGATTSLPSTNPDSHEVADYPTPASLTMGVGVAPSTLHFSLSTRMTAATEINPQKNTNEEK